MNQSAKSEIQTEPLPPHVEETVHAVEQMRTDHHFSATPIDRAFGRVKALVGAPSFILSTIILVVIWIGGNLALHSIAWDPPPFSYLGLIFSTLAFLVTVLILATQRRADSLADHREQLILQLAFVSEQKTAKIIGLLEELRRDSPQVRDRVDHVAEQMTEIVDPKAVSNALRDAAESVRSDARPGE